MVNLRLWPVGHAVVDMRVEADGLYLCSQNADAVLGDMSANRSFKADVISQFEVGDVDVARQRVSRHIQQDRSDPGKRSGDHRRVLGRVNFKDILVGKVKAHAVGPVSTGGIEPLLACELDHDRLSGGRHTGGRGRGRR